MTDYAVKAPGTLPSFVSEAKEKRKKVLEAVYERRKIIYKRYFEKLEKEKSKSSYT
jgi:hypothetical protein